MTLKDQIEKVKITHKLETERKEEEAQARIRVEKEEAKQTAQTIIGQIPSRVRMALANNRDSISLYRDRSVPMLLEASGNFVFEALKEILRAEGLHDQLYIDVDCSGNFSTANDLRLKI